MDAESLNSPRWPRVSKGGFHEAWFVSGSDAKAGYGLWLRYGVDLDRAGAPDSSIWGSWFERDASERTFVIRNMVDDATISRTGVAFGAAGLTESGCTGEVEAGGHSLRWRLSFGQGAPAEDVIPAWLSPIARLRLSGYVLPHAKTTLSGAVEVDGRMSELQRMPALQGHLWGRSYWPAWAWARCSGFTEDPDASAVRLRKRLHELTGAEVGVIVSDSFGRAWRQGTTDVAIGLAGIRPLLDLTGLRFRGGTHRFGELPWMLLSVSRPAAPAWHFSAQDARLSIDGVVRATVEQMVQVQYPDADGSLRHCVHTAVASMEVQVRSRAVPGAPWRPEGTLTSKSGASLEFCGREADARVTRGLVSAPARRRNPSGAGSVAS